MGDFHAYHSKFGSLADSVMTAINLNTKTLNMRLDKVDDVLEGMFGYIRWQAGTIERLVAANDDRLDRARRMVSTMASGVLGVTIPPDSDPLAAVEALTNAMVDAANCPGRCGETAGECLQPPMFSAEALLREGDIVLNKQALLDAGKEFGEHNKRFLLRWCAPPKFPKRDGVADAPAQDNLDGVVDVLADDPLHLAETAAADVPALAACEAPVEEAHVDGVPPLAVEEVANVAPATTDDGLKESAPRQTVSWYDGIANPFEAPSGPPLPPNEGPSGVPSESEETPAPVAEERPVPRTHASRRRSRRA